MDALAVRGDHERLAIAASSFLTVPDAGWVSVAHRSFYVVFLVDYFTSLALSTDRRTFMRHNIPDLIAILPLRSVPHYESSAASETRGL